MPAYDINTAELEAVAKKLIDQRADMELIKMLRLSFLFRPEAVLSAGRIVCGMCIRVDDRNWTLSKNDFIIEIAKDVWDDASPEFREALMHHELCHIGFHMDKENPTSPAIAESGRLRTFCKPHEIEEFEVVLKTHGTYHEGLRRFIKAHEERLKAPKKPASTAGEDLNLEDTGASTPSEEGELTLP